MSPQFPAHAMRIKLGHRLRRDCYPVNSSQECFLCIGRAGLWMLLFGISFIISGCHVDTKFLKDKVHDLIPNMSYAKAVHVLNETRHLDLSKLAKTYNGPMGPMGLACEAGACSDNKSEKAQCSTVNGPQSCVKDHTTTASGKTCIGGIGYGRQCDYWVTSWQYFREQYYSQRFGRYSWCYVDIKTWDWDMCVPSRPQIFAGWVSREPCLPWKVVAADKSSIVKLLHHEMVDVHVNGAHKRLPETVTSWYSPDGSEWYNQDVIGDRECALPAFATAAGPDDLFYPRRRLLQDKHGELFVRPYCLTQTGQGPRVVQCVDPCAPSACSRHGACVANSATDPVRCMCPHGWQGAECDEPYNASTNKPRSATCEELRGMGLDSKATSYLTVYWALVQGFWHALDYALVPAAGDGPAGVGSVGVAEAPENVMRRKDLLKDSYEDFGPPWFQTLSYVFVFTPIIVAGICFILWVCFVILGMCCPCCNRSGKPVECCKCLLWIVGLALALIALPYLIVPPVFVLAAVAAPVATYYQIWHMERALVTCVGPIGVNVLMSSAVFLLLIIGFCIHALCRRCVRGRRHERAVRLLQLDWAMEIFNIYSDWFSFVALNASSSVILGQPIFGMVDLSHIKGVPFVHRVVHAFTVRNLLFGACIASTYCVIEAFLSAARSPAGVRAPPAWVVKNVRGLHLARIRVVAMVVLMVQTLANLIQVGIPFAAVYYLSMPFVPDVTVYSALISAYQILDALKVLCCMSEDPSGRYRLVPTSSGGEMSDTSAEPQE